MRQLLLPTITIATLLAGATGCSTLDPITVPAAEAIIKGVEEVDSNVYFVLNATHFFDVVAAWEFYAALHGMPENTTEDIFLYDAECFVSANALKFYYKWLSREVEK